VSMSGWRASGGVSSRYTTEATQMAGGGWRAECVCGWWLDFDGGDSEGYARKAVKEHLKAEKQKKKQELARERR
jgi:hypothetical protein